MIEPVSEYEGMPAPEVRPVDDKAPIVLVTKAPTIAEHLSSQVIPLSKLTNLPTLIVEAVKNRRGAVGSEQTAALKAMRESQRLITIGRMSAEIVHEINNPLESVGNLLYLALHEPGIPERACEFLRAAEHEMQRVVHISKQTLSFSRESSEPIPIQVAELMDEVVALYSRRISQKKLSVVREYTAADPVLAFPGEIRQVLSNLVTNAIEASTPEGKLRLRVRQTFQYKAKGWGKPGVRITVGDNGSGIPAIARKRLGEIFFTTKGETGTGLGLWVTNAIIARYGGTMRLRSSTGERHGTTFTVFLPPVPATGIESTDEQFKSQTGGNVTEISQHRSYAHQDSFGHSAAGHAVRGDSWAPRQRKG
jgi:signal transduction histidine kinase